MYVIFLIVSLLVCENLSSSCGQAQYVYPVASFAQQDGAHLLVLSQRSLEQLELYDWSARTGQMTKILMSLYTPSCVKMLPDGSGFSFVDNGRIRIKRFEKRSVKSLDMYDPIYGIEQISWLDCEHCYFHAQSDGRYGIYMFSLDEELTSMLVDASTDYMYPVIIDQSLFFIERTQCQKSYGYKICRHDLKSKAFEALIDFGARPLAMLAMHSACEGFVLEPDNQAGVQRFHYDYLFKARGSWQFRELFSFSVPQYFLADGPERVYESFLPFIPRHVGNFIFFSTFDEAAQRMVLYKFDRETAKSTVVVQAPSSVFVPVFFEHQGWCGGKHFPSAIVSVKN